MDKVAWSSLEPKKVKTPCTDQKMEKFNKKGGQMGKIDGETAGDLVMSVLLVLAGVAIIAIIMSLG